MLRKLGSASYRLARRIVIAVIGGTVLLAGVIMIVTPGPALVVIPVGLGILGLEFAWARQWLGRIREGASPEGLKRLQDGWRQFRDRIAGRRPGGE